MEAPGVEASSDTGHQQIQRDSARVVDLATRRASRGNREQSAPIPSAVTRVATALEVLAERLAKSTDRAEREALALAIAALAGDQNADGGQA